MDQDREGEFSFEKINITKKAIEILILMCIDFKIRFENGKAYAYKRKERIGITKQFKSLIDNRLIAKDNNDDYLLTTDGHLFLMKIEEKRFNEMMEKIDQDIEKRAQKEVPT